MATAATTTHSTTTIDTYSKVLWALDYVPIVSSVKQIVDLFFSHVWYPADPDQLPSFVYAYHQHLENKDTFRYISIIPVLGNLVLIIKDVFQCLGDEFEETNSDDLENPPSLRNNERDSDESPRPDPLNFNPIFARLNERLQREREQLDQLQEQIAQRERAQSDPLRELTERWNQRARELRERIAQRERERGINLLPEAPQRISLRPEEFVGTLPYDSANIPPEIQTKADEIAQLFERAEASNVHIPQGYICPISQEVMSIPVFDYTHPSINAVNINYRDLRHLVDKTSLEGMFASGRAVRCPACRHPESGQTARNNLRIDTAFQDEILEFLRRNIPAPVV